MSDFVHNPEEAREYLSRYKIFYITISIVITLFTIRLWYLQIIKGTELREFSEKNRIKQNKIAAPRGLMLDRDGKVLVENLPGFEAVIYPQYVQDIQTVSQNTGSILGLEPAKIIQKIQKSRKQNGPFFPVRIKENLNREEVLRLKRIRLDNPGLEIQESIVRSYPLRDNGAQLFGYVGEISKKNIPNLNKKYKGVMTFAQGDIIGQSGLEETLEEYIRGIDGIKFIQVDAHGRETFIQTPNIYGQEIKDQDPINGKNVVLTIDRDIQEAAHKSFADLQRIGAIIAVRTNGEVLAWVSSPSFDPNEFSTGISPQIWSKLINDPFKPLRNKVIQDHTAPGSTFKPYMALAALQEKVITDKTIVHAPGVFQFGRRPYHDSIRGGHGNITVYEAIERSSNVFFFKMGIALNIDKMYNYISLFGLGKKTGIELPREVPGIMPNANWKKQKVGEEWQPGENLSTAIGQGFVITTPIQMAMGYNTIALEGKLYKPFVIKKVLDTDGKVIKETQPELVRDLTQTQANGVSISKENFKIVKEAMRRVANGDRGTAKWWKIPGVQMAGKTGTSQVMNFSADKIYSKCENNPIYMRHHGWYVAFAPYENPEITVAVLAEHSCHGNTGAAPVVRDIVLAYMKKYHPDVIEAGIKNKKAQVVPQTPIVPSED